MTISGNIPVETPGPDVELMPASLAQPYIAKLESSLAGLDGAPVYLVHDKETGTSDNLVSELHNGFLEEENAASLPISNFLDYCFRNKLNFRVWLADNNPNAFLENSAHVINLETALQSIKNRQGAWWHAC